MPDNYLGDYLALGGGGFYDGLSGGGRYYDLAEPPIVTASTQYVRSIIPNVWLAETIA